VGDESGEAVLKDTLAWSVASATNRLSETCYHMKKFTCHFIFDTFMEMTPATYFDTTNVADTSRKITLTCHELTLEDLRFKERLVMELLSHFSPSMLAQP